MGSRVALVIGVVAVLATGCGRGDHAESVSTGPPVRGSLRNGLSLPLCGPGFVSYALLGNVVLGRQYVNSRVRKTMVSAFSALHEREPDRVFVTGDLGLRRQAEKNGLAIGKVIMAPEYVERVLAAMAPGESAKLSDVFLRRPAWVRHDEHLHVDFVVVENGK